MEMVSLVILLRRISRRPTLEIEETPAEGSTEDSSEGVEGYSQRLRTYCQSPGKFF
jgi:hypothetical protein